jgi:hypothetical protein
MFSSSPQHTLAPECGLDRKNIQLLTILGLFSKSKIQRFIFLVNLKATSTYCDKGRPDLISAKILSVKIVEYEHLSGKSIVISQLTVKTGVKGYHPDVRDGQLRARFRFY